MQSVVIKLLDTMNNTNVRSQRKMRDSGVAWIGEVPEGWTIGALKHYGSVYNGREIANEVSADDSNAIPVYGSGGVFKYTDKKQYEGAAVLFGRKGTIGRPMFVNGSFATVDTMYYSTYDRNRVVAKYIYHLLSSFDWQPYATHTAVPSLVASDVFNLPFCFPPLPEQQAIADYLDRECGKIDALRAKIEAQIADLATYKKSVITEAVTGKCKIENGEWEMRPRTEHRDSGIAWIGAVPKGWKVKRFVHEFTFAKGLNITKADLIPDGVPVVSYGQIHSRDNDGIHLTENLLRFVSSKTASLGSASRLFAGDIVFADTSEDYEGAGNCVRIDTNREVYAGYHTLVARPCHRECSHYLSFLFKSQVWRDQIARNVNGIKVYSVTQKVFRDVTFLMPPLSEQREIADYLDKKCAAIDAAVAKCRAQLEDLATYKKSLIFECVTGKKEIA